MKNKILICLVAVAALATAGKTGPIIGKICPVTGQGMFISFATAADVSSSATDEDMPAKGQLSGVSKPAAEVRCPNCPVFRQIQAGSGNIVSREAAGNEITAVHGKAVHKSQFADITTDENTVTYNPPSPQDAPDDIKDAVMLGYNIITDTQSHASQYAGNKLNCTNCHFDGGITQGGKNGGISLVGVASKYPAYRQRENAVISLATKVNACFRRSMNGQPLPPEGEEMTAILTYLQWIAKDLPIYAEIPWLGLKQLESDHTPDHEKGKQIFSLICAACHGLGGQGQVGPPLWGNDSFNDGASINQVQNMAAFVYNNMPKGNPILSVEEALDAAAYVTSQPRPHYEGR
ncbi:MAG: c-type cytochrome [bacterium]